MVYKALYRTYRPHSFETVVGQKHIVQTLQNALKQRKISHAYLFCGPRGTGKTTVAKLVAKSVNCINQEQAPCNECEYCKSIQSGNHPDVIEIDAASNNGVDEIRDLIEKVKYAPLQAKYKVYIVDEVHMLTQGAFNALLKTLEEPPSHVIFILATTEPHKVLPTIISRCQRYDFVRVNTKAIQGRIEEVLDQENIKYESEATRLISQLADGGVRDALSILEQVIAYSGEELSTQHVNDIYGIATTQDKFRILDAIIRKDVSDLMNEIDFISKKNIDIKRLTNDLMELLKESIVFAFTNDQKLLNKLSVNEAQSLNRIEPLVGLKMIEDLMDTAEKYRTASDLMSYFEIGLLKVMGHLTHTEAKPQIIEKVEVAKKPTEKNIQPLKEIVNKVEKPIIKEAKNNEVKQGIEEEKVQDVVQDKELKNEDKKAEAIQNDQNSFNIKDQIRILSIEDRIALFVAGDKVVRLKLSQEWMKIANSKLDFKWAKVAHLLADTDLVAANTEFLAVSHSDSEIVSELNSLDHEEELISFVEYLFNEPRRVFAMSKEEYAEAVNEFMKRSTQGKLPEAKVVSKKIKKQKIKIDDDVESAVFDLFGEENVEKI